MKIIRVLVYEGDEAKLKADLQRRAVKGSRVGRPGIDLAITERFEGNALGGDHEVRVWLDEAGPLHDARVGAAALREGPYAITCTYCNAAPGLPCVNPQGNAVAVHGARVGLSPQDWVIQQEYDAALQVPCPGCEVPAGTPCQMNKTQVRLGKKVTHPVRLEAAKRAGKL